jgi:hypothetical protein
VTEIARLGRAALGVGLGALISFGCEVVESDAEQSDGVERTGRVRSTVIGASPSTSADDFVVFLTRRLPNDQTVECGASLVAPNLLLTAKHCLYNYDHQATSFCDATGEPQPGSLGGYITGTIPVQELVVYPGADGKKRFRSEGATAGDGAAAKGKQIIDDQSTTFCSHDIAYLLVDTPITDKPIGRLRLAKRPDAAAKLTLAGWGDVEKTPPAYGTTAVRLRRSGIAIQRVGPANAIPGATGSLGPRTFETGPGGCTGDSGSPGFEEQTGAVFGVLARALNLDPENAVSPCAPETVTNVYMTVADSNKLLRDAFTAAGAEPWLEGRSAAGFLRFGEACSSNLECEGDLCAGLTETVTTGTCNVDCGKGGRTCPSGYVCGSAGQCETPAPAAPPPAAPAPTSTIEAPPPEAPEEAVSASGNNCATLGSARLPRGVAPSILTITACAALARRIRLRRRS